ncbi:hypothetical protein SLE2022_207810 [Rubroshorea leprosula]
MLDHVERDCEVALEIKKTGITERPYGEMLQETPKYLWQAREVGGAWWLRDFSRNHMVTEAWRRHLTTNLSIMLNMETEGMEVDSNLHDLWGIKDGLCNIPIERNRDLPP